MRLNKKLVIYSLLVFIFVLLVLNISFGGITLTVNTTDSPGNGSYYSSTSSFDFNFTALDTNYSIITECNLTINNNVNKTIYNVSNNTKTNFTVASFPDGVYTWSVTCLSNTSQTNTTGNYTFTNDLTGPTVTINTTICPTSGGYYSTLGNFNFSFVPTDNHFGTILQCNLTIGGALNQTLNDSVNNTLANFTPTNFSDGVYNWQIFCKDNMSNKGNSSLYTFTNDLTAPNILVNEIPTDGATYYSSSGMSFNINFTPEENHYTTVLECNLTVNDALNISLSDLTNNSKVILNLTVISAGIYNWSISCVDNMSNLATTDLYNFTHSVVATGPTVTVNTTESPEDGGYYDDTSAAFSFNFTATDPTFTTIKACNLTTNGALNQTITDLPNGTEGRFNVTRFLDGFYNWSISCKNNVSISSSTSLYNFTMDNTSPIITINAPGNASLHSNNYILVNIRVYDLIPKSTPFCTYNLTGASSSSAA